MDEDTAGPDDVSAPRRRPGVRLAIDVGTVRIGVAASDPDGLLASPVETVPRDLGAGRDLERIAALVDERGAAGVIVGLPRRLAGDEGPAAVAARAYASKLAARIAPVPVRLLDERLTTVTAQRGLHDVGIGTRRGRAVIDQAAAVVLLQAALETQSRTGADAGELVPAAG
jgi:putative Holliday junction resolvase